MVSLRGITIKHLSISLGFVISPELLHVVLILVGFSLKLFSAGFIFRFNLSFASMRHSDR